MKKLLILSLALTAVLALPLSAQENDKHNTNTTQRMLEEQLFFTRMSDICYVDFVRITGPARAVQTPTGCAFKDSLLDNKLKFYSYLFFPNEVEQGSKYPLIILSHGGIHSQMPTSYVHILRELVAQGYIVACPEYRGSTGYGKSFYEAIDYGGLENEDALALRDYMVECYSVVDESRIGLVGWSHGGMISLMNILNYPEKYTCAYAGVPVSDVAYRLSYQEKSYTRNFTQPYHVNATPEEAPEEYARRSPVTYASKLCRPLMITTCINDADGSWTEVKRMIDALEAAGKDFEYKIYPPMDGAHSFERIDIKEASDIRFETYKFLARYLKPAHPFSNTDELRKAGYMFY